jgi:hypothetical protein
VLDMFRWMEPRYIHARHENHFREVLMFGLKDRPMPFAIQGTYITSFKPGRVPPPAMDLSNYRVLDERFRDLEKERQEYEREKERTRVITLDDINDVPVPEPPMEPMPPREPPEMVPPMVPR